jgi:hypothetical protein
MSWGKWMIVEFSIEEELQIESQARTVLGCNDSKEVARLCSSLVKQNAYYQKLLRQATGHIAELEMIAFLDEDAKSQCASDDSDPTRLGDTQDQSLLSGLLLTVLSMVVAFGFAVHRLWHRVTRARNQEIRG